MPPIEWARTTEPEWLDRFDNATIYDDLLPDGDDILRAMAECASRERENLDPVAFSLLPLPRVLFI